jgi:hypothetical protein
MGPPPITTSDEGSSLVEVASRLLQYPAASRPSIGGMKGTEPVERITDRASIETGVPPVPAASTRPGARTRPVPRTNSIPSASRAFTCPASLG